MSKLNDFIANNSNIFKLIGSIAVIVTIFIAVDGYIDTKIERKITDTTYISKLSKQLRPFLIFDENGVVQYDHGAESKIKDISVDFDKESIVIETSEFMQLAPFIFTVGSETFSLEPKRIDNKKWRYTMLYYRSLAISGGSTKEPKTNFVLEILYSQ
jgi:hypothetical protein